MAITGGCHCGAVRQIPLRGHCNLTRQYLEDYPSLLGNAKDPTVVFYKTQIDPAVPAESLHQRLPSATVLVHNELMQRHHGYAPGAGGLHGAIAIVYVS
jgi:hypothetical protein